MAEAHGRMCTCGGDPPKTYLLCRCCRCAVQPAAVLHCEPISTLRRRRKNVRQSCWQIVVWLQATASRVGVPIHSAHSTAAVTRPRCGHGGGLAGGAVFQSGCGHRVTRTARVRTRAVSTARHCTQWTPRPWCTRTACPHARRHAEARHFTRGCRPLHTWHSLRHVAGAWAGWLAGWLRCGSG